MLQETKGAWSVSCERCRTVQALKATSMEAARDAAKVAGWLDQARKGKGVANWPWLCPRCRPTPVPPSAMGRST